MLLFLADEDVELDLSSNSIGGRKFSLPHDEDIINPISPSPLAHQNGVAYKLDHVSLEQLTLALLDEPVTLRLTWIIFECGTISELVVLLT